VWVRPQYPLLKMTCRKCREENQQQEQQQLNSVVGRKAQLTVSQATLEAR